MTQSRPGEFISLDGTRGQDRATGDCVEPTVSTWACDTTKNFIEGAGYSQISLTDHCNAAGVCDANPIYTTQGRANDNDAAVEYCKVQAQHRAAAGFFFQKHTNGHEICGFYTGDVMHGDGAAWVWHGHETGQVCEVTEAVGGERTAEDVRTRNGSYATFPNQTECDINQDCPAGQFVSADGTLTTDRVCEPCAEETFSLFENVFDCTQMTTCQPGEYVTLQGTPTNDRECAPCADETYTD